MLHNLQYTIWHVCTSRRRCVCVHTCASPKSIYFYTSFPTHSHLHTHKHLRCTFSTDVQRPGNTIGSKCMIFWITRQSALHNIHNFRSVEGAICRHWPPVESILKKKYGGSRSSEPLAAGSWELALLANFSRYCCNKTYWTKGTFQTALDNQVFTTTSSLLLNRISWPAV